MRHIAWWLLALLSLTGAEAGRRPRYGGSMQVALRETPATLDPGSESILTPLVFDRLSALILDRSHDPEARRWECRLRPDVKFHDGSPLAATPALAAALESAMEGVSVKVRGPSLVFECPRPCPDLAFDTFVFARSAEGAAAGTGPFRVTRWEAGRHATLAANEDYWAGRPFLDTVEIEMGRGGREQLLDLEVGKVDLAQLAVPDARRARRVWASAPLELLAVVFRDGSPAEETLRQALALAVDRTAIHNVIFQRQGEVAGSLLPQWISGYAFLFPTTANLPRARRLAAAAQSRAFTLGYDGGEGVSRLVAERVALNARDAGMAVSVVSGTQADAQVRRLRIPSPDTSLALERIARALGITEWQRAGTPEALYASEHALLDGHRVIPLLHVPLVFAAGPRLRTWNAPVIGPSGDLRLADVWLEARGVAGFSLPSPGAAVHEGRLKPATLP